MSEPSPDDSPAPTDQPPLWVRDAVFYQIFPDRFAASDRVAKPGNLEEWDTPPTIHGYKGGDLLGVVEHLDWLVDLGINAIYLNPIFQSASNHRYHTHDYYTVDPLLGGNSAFAELLSAAHDRGIRVVLDGVFNHASRGFFQFNDIAENGPNSPWVDWFTIHEWPVDAYGSDAPNYHAWWGLPALPKFNTDNPQVREFLFGVGEHWAAAGIDGWRLDVPQEITTPGFWEEFRVRVKSVNPELYLVAEIWDDASEWINNGDLFDGTMDYQLGALVLSFALGSRIRPDLVTKVPYDVSEPLDAASFDAGIRRLRSLYRDTATLANLTLVDSHDTPRLMSLADQDANAAKIALTLLLTLPGAPSIYYGDEVGLSGEQDPDNRRAFPWQRPESWNQTLLAAVRELIALRAGTPALRSPTYGALHAGSGSSLLVVHRGSGDHQAVVAVNAGVTPASASFIDQPGRWEMAWGDGATDASGGDRSVTLAAQSAAIWHL